VPNICKCGVQIPAGSEFCQLCRKETATSTLDRAITSSYTTTPIAISTRVVYGLGLSLVWLSIVMWVPIIGWILVTVAPVVFFVPVIAMKAIRQGICPHCKSAIRTRWKANSFKCWECRQMVIITHTEFTAE
jgi:hypothetical protein